MPKCLSRFTFHINDWCYSVYMYHLRMLSISSVIKKIKQSRSFTQVVNRWFIPETNPNPIDCKRLNYKKPCLTLSNMKEIIHSQAFLPFC